MSEHALQPDGVAAGTRTADEPPQSLSALRCQWCSVPLAAGTTICPTCGSAGIPDPRMTVPDVPNLDAVEPDPLSAASTFEGTAGETGELIEWWRDDTESGSAATRPQQLTHEDVEQRQLQTLAFIGGAVVFCALFGWFVGPAFLEGPIEGLTGTPVENRGDLRGMGAFVGLIFGMFVGASGGWAIWSSR